MNRLIIGLVLLFCSFSVPAEQFDFYEIGGTVTRIKEGVVLKGVRYEMIMAVVTANRVWKNHGHILVITSGYRENSLTHKKGVALDLRTRYFKRWQIISIVNDLKRTLGHRNYDFKIEGDQIHLSSRM